MKLTPAQTKIHQEMKAKGSYQCIDEYKPMVGLVNKGLAHKTRQGTYGHSTFELTDAGKEWKS